MPDSPVEQQLAVGPKSQPAGPCHCGQIDPSVAHGDRHTSARLAMASTSQQAIMPPTPPLMSAVPQQHPLAASDNTAVRQQHPVHSNTINIRLELGAPAQHCCNCRLQCAPAEPHANRKRQQHPMQSPSTGMPQLLSSTLPAAAGLPESQSTRLVQITSRSSHNCSSDHRAADGTDEQLGWPPIWTIQPLQKQQVVLQSECRGKCEMRPTVSHWYLLLRCGDEMHEVFHANNLCALCRAGLAQLDTSWCVSRACTSCTLSRCTIRVSLQWWSPTACCRSCAQQPCSRRSHCA